MNPEIEETEMTVKEARETVVELNHDGIMDTSKCEENQENNDEISHGVCPQNNRNVDYKESVEEVDVQSSEARLTSEKGNDEMFIISEDDIKEESVMGSEDANDLDPHNDAVTINEKQISDDSNTTKEALLVPEKKVIKRKKLVKKRKLVKGKLTVAKNEDEPQSSDMPDLSDQTDQAYLKEDDIKEESVMGSEDANDLDPRNDAVTINEKQINDDSNTTKEALLVPEKKVIKRKKLVKKRKLVKGKLTVAKNEDKPQSSDMPDLSDQVRTDQNVKNEENPIGKIMDNLNKSSTVGTKKNNSQQITGKLTIKSKQKEVNKQAGKVKIASESQDMDYLNEEAKTESKAKLNKIMAGEVNAEDKDEAEPSNKLKSSKKVESMGMIFMCNSKTKEDCYRYNILGLPASKKDQVLKIYQGMRLFLFDTDSKLLYGIYKAAAPGGYNIEPKAFRSNYPSQVRFTTVSKCSPVPEEKFKKVIKDNYYTKYKFHSELNSKQVKSLCKLFRVVNKASKLKGTEVAPERPKVIVNPAVERAKKTKARIEIKEQRRERRVLDDTERDNKRRRVLDGVNHSTRDRFEAKPFRARADVKRQRPKNDVKHSRAEDDIRRRMLEDDARRLRAEDEERRLRFEEERRLRIEEEERRLRIEEDVRRLRADDRIVRSLNENRYLHHADDFGREMYLPSAGLSAPVHPDDLPPYTSSYTGSGRAPLLADYRLDTAFQSEDRGLQYSSRPRNLYEYETPYLAYREPNVYRDAGYDASARRSYYSPLASRDEHVPSSSRTSRYRLSPYRRY